jgi:general secretion pathway protein C
MRYPLWLLNSILFILLMSTFLFIAFSREQLPEREDIEPKAIVMPRTEGVSTINIKQIYENDFFGTYKKEIAPVEEKKFVVPLPEPPSRVEAVIPEEPKPQFLEPLALTLKGIIAVSDGTKNEALIEENATKREASYKVGDKFEDAQIIRILKNKVIFVRSNGQQEVFYLRQSDAKTDPTFLVINDWNGVVRKVAPNNYSIYLEAFQERVKNLAQFIELMGMTTAYSKGQSIGCRIGATTNDSLAQELGMRPGDVILTVNGIPATDTEHRTQIFKDVTSLGVDSVITLRLMRGGQTYTLRYKFADFSVIKKPSGPNQPVTARYIEEEQRKMLERKQKLAPTIRDLRKQERQNMLNKGKRPNEQAER